MTITVLGVDALVARLARGIIAGEVAEVQIPTTLAGDVAALAQVYVPVDTGRLRDSITAGPTGVSTDVEYAPFVEYGTSDTTAQPFLRPAADTVDETATLEAAALILGNI
jgi:HK97 gp10 family phage protein